MFLSFSELLLVSVLFVTLSVLIGKKTDFESGATNTKKALYILSNFILLSVYYILLMNKEIFGLTLMVNGLSEIILVTVIIYSVIFPIKFMR
ncbi:hypothetical protein AL013_06045 [Mariprofundus ferrooxydans]|uniref:Uncharacterized protein n=1 Tax=Mariprofundus ferrooxydans PV-1 TaxID=314345 RepID=Q0EY01_9PROT|nr:hypothetical protein SPV1_05672 [Mariprofundus ferrooxydans PV-1]KON47773.1 hypothetical protein AL013_06045 [Mariprofundus ferrooxydans]